MLDEFIHEHIRREHGFELPCDYLVFILRVLVDTKEPAEVLIISHGVGLLFLPQMVELFVPNLE